MPRDLSAAWYAASTSQFLSLQSSEVVAALSSAALREGWHVDSEQHEEWNASVSLLQGGLAGDPALEAYQYVVLEYDFRRRGIRIDCVLLGPGIIAVLEFKRSKLAPADADQVTNYCINLVEFHGETRRLIGEAGVVLIPALVLTRGRAEDPSEHTLFHEAPWEAVLDGPLHCDWQNLTRTLRFALGLRRGAEPAPLASWVQSPFSPSSTILDAAISLFGQHDVSAIRTHAGAIESVDRVVSAVAQHVHEAKSERKNRVVFVSGAPGAGKTLVGLQLAFHEEFRQDAVFVTGNAPLVDVLNEALKQSYRKKRGRAAEEISGYPRESARFVIENATFKLVKAHHFLGRRGDELGSTDGSVVVFDEAQRTYEKGRLVLREKLTDHEADLILEALELSHPDGAVVVALLGHNQAINRGERGGVAWLEAAERRDWGFAISEETLEVGEFLDADRWKSHSLRLDLAHGHLRQSLRFYRNRDVEAWVDAVMRDDVARAQELGQSLADEGHQIWLTRDLGRAREWIRDRRVGAERAGLIGSGQGHRLAAEGLFVGLKPPIASWMLAPSGDVRSSNMLETIQNQYQVQGLELDYTVVCWDADLRRTASGWKAWKLSGTKWQSDSALDVAMNSYRVLLTRARKGMIVFVPTGDSSGEDATRKPEFYDDVADHLLTCGAIEWEGK